MNVRGPTAPITTTAKAFPSPGSVLRTVPPRPALSPAAVDPTLRASPLRRQSPLRSLRRPKPPAPSHPDVSPACFATRGTSWEPFESRRPEPLPSISQGRAGPVSYKFDSQALAFTPRHSSYRPAPATAVAASIDFESGDPSLRENCTASTTQHLLSRRFDLPSTAILSSTTTKSSPHRLRRASLRIPPSCDETCP